MEIVSVTHHSLSVEEVRFWTLLSPKNIYTQETAGMELLLGNSGVSWLYTLMIAATIYNDCFQFLEKSFK